MIAGMPVCNIFKPAVLGDADRDMEFFAVFVLSRPCWKKTRKNPMPSISWNGTQDTSRSESWNQAGTGLHRTSSVSRPRSSIKLLL